MSDLPAILLVDDNELIRESVGSLLAQLGYTTTVVKDGFKALSSFQNGRFKLILTDYRMPGMLGTELARRIKAQDPGQPILLMTGCPQAGLEMASNIDAFLPKPFTLNELKDGIAKALAHPVLAPKKQPLLPGDHRAVVGAGHLLKHARRCGARTPR